MRLLALRFVQGVKVAGKEATLSVEVPAAAWQGETVGVRT
jgi:hypothetical protein